MIPGCALKTVKMYCPQVSALEFTGLRKTFLFARDKQLRRQHLYFFGQIILRIFIGAFGPFLSGTTKDIIDNTERE